MRVEIGLASTDRDEVLRGLVQVVAALGADERYTEVHMYEEDREHILVATTTIVRMDDNDSEHQQQ